MCQLCQYRGPCILFAVSEILYHVPSISSLPLFIRWINEIWIYFLVEEKLKCHVKGERKALMKVALVRNVLRVTAHFLGLWRSIWYIEFCTFKIYNLIQFWNLFYCPLFLEWSFKKLEFTGWKEYPLKVNQMADRDLGFSTGMPSNDKIPVISGQ